MSDFENRAIGGYFELELPTEGVLPFGVSKMFQSARSAFLALLRAGKPNKVWMPKYICNSMIAPLEAAGIECLWYDLDDRFVISSNISVGEDEWVLYVNYFGVCDRNVDELLQRIPPDRIVLDYSQSFFSPPRKEVLATIYSPRKFFGVPDGGILFSRVAVNVPETQDRGSIERAYYLMQRLGSSPESGYAAFQQAEETLSDIEPNRMSQLTKRILASVDFDMVRRKREENFQFLHKRLASVNRLHLDMPVGLAPMCYPLITCDAGLRANLISHRIFVATYWEDAVGRVRAKRAEAIANLLPLPIDQRYGRTDMEKLVSIILENVT